MSKSKVFFSNMRARGKNENRVNKIQKLFEAADFKSLIRPKDLCAIKLHFGERGNDTFLNPVFARRVVDLVRAAGGKPFLTDTNTMYKGFRQNSVDHLETALRNGFSYATVDAPVLIADGLRGDSYVEVRIDKKHFKKVKIAETIYRAGSMIVLSHFKGHILGGFGGAMKNLAMGCAANAGKRDQHTRYFTVDPEKCVACGLCLANCPTGAARWKKEDGQKRAYIKPQACIACGECMTVCAAKAIAMDYWDHGMAEFAERMMEYALGAAKCKEGRAGYMNFLMNITPECDCVPWSDAPMVPDIGILASHDPVALDKACYDLVNAQTAFSNSTLACNHEPGADKFKAANPQTMGEVQFTHAVEIGLGSVDYELVEI